MIGALLQSLHTYLNRIWSCAGASKICCVLMGIVTGMPISNSVVGIIRCVDLSLLSAEDWIDLDRRRAVVIDGSHV